MCFREIFFLICTCFSVAYSIKLHYKNKLENKEGLFGVSVSASHQNVVIGTWSESKKSEPLTIIEKDEIKKILPPIDVEGFGVSAASNDQYILTSACTKEEGIHYSLFVYAAYESYDLIARIPIDIQCSHLSVTIGEDNTIAISADVHSDFPDPHVSVLQIFQYNGAGAWSKEKEWNIEHGGFGTMSCITVSGAWIAVGYPGFGFTNAVDLFQRVDNIWEHKQTIYQPRPVNKYLFGFSVAMDLQNLVVASVKFNDQQELESQEVFVYRRGTKTDKWIPHGSIVVSISGEINEHRVYNYGGVATSQGLIAIVPVTDGTNSTLTTKIFKQDQSGWEECLNLTAEPLKGKQVNWKVSCSGDSVYTSRIGENDDGSEDGVVYIYDLSDTSRCVSSSKCK